ncbi:MAG TPA: hypothetical protein VGF24_09120 [Vicinamibacterales bacterium]
MSSLMLTLRRAGVLLVLLVAAGVFVQLSGVVTLAASVLGLSAGRIGLDAAALLTPRKIATAVVFSMVAAAAWGVLRRDACGRLLAGIPPLTADAAGLFRIAFAMALLCALLVEGPVHPGLNPELVRAAGPLASWSWAKALAVHESATIWIHYSLVALVVLLAIGLCTRTVTVMLAAAATLNAIVLLQRQSAHDWGLPVVALWLLTIVPWGDAYSLDAAMRRRSGAPAAARDSAQYGLAIWMPGIALGLAFLAAAFAKIDATGITWITEGAVRYHFVEDSRRAPVDWGLRIAASDVLSRLFSLGAVVVETVLIVHVLARTSRARLAFGLAAASLLLGFFLFQGVIWPLWWTLLVAFLPWPRQQPQQRPHAWLPRWQVAVIAAFVLQQVVFSSLHLEMEPLISDYGMYSFSFPSKEAFDRHLANKLRRVRVEQTPRGPRTIAEEPVFDWERGQFGPPRVIYDIRPEP